MSYTYADLDRDEALVREAFEVLDIELGRDAEDDLQAWEMQQEAEVALTAFNRIMSAVRAELRA